MSTVVDSEALRFPVGRVQLQPDPDAQAIAGWIDVIEALPANLRAAVAGLDDHQLDTPYRPGGWTVRQVVHHVPDSHLNAYLRTNWTLTEDRPTIKPYDQDAWAALPYSRSAPVTTSLDLLQALHAHWTSTLRVVSAHQFQREYIHPEDQRTYRLSDLLQIYAWHSRHHVAHITTLRERNQWT